MPSPAKDPLLGRTIAQRYRLIAHLGAGSVASVYLARHVLIDRLGAIKIVHPELARDRVWRERFLREARAVNRINHPNIVEITDLGEADGLLFLVMEYVPGESLKQTLERGPLGWRRAAAIGLQLALALGRAHQMGVVHRGLDASNVMLVARRDGGDLVKLTDFGVAHLADAAPLTQRIASLPDPEGLRDLDARSDLLALGAVIHEASVGTPPTPSASRIADAPAFFEEVLSTLLAPDPDDRPRDAFEAADLLRRALEAEALLSTPPGLDRPSWWPVRDSAFDAAASGSDPRPRPRPPAEAMPASTPPSSPPPLHLGDPPGGEVLRRGVVGAPIDRLASLCAAALSVLEERIDVAGAELDGAARAALAESRKLCTTVSALSELVASDTRALEVVQARGRGARAELGRRLDEAARERSRALGWAGTIAERSYQVEVQRLSGEHPVPAIDAMVWEQAALEQEEDFARERAARLAAEMHACQSEIERHNERLEHEVLVINACLEGRIGAVRTLASEAWTGLESAALRAGIDPAELCVPGR